MLDDGTLPSLELRKLEVEANDIFAIYRDQWGPLLTSSLSLFFIWYIVYEKNYFVLTSPQFSDF